MGSLPATRIGLLWRQNQSAEMERARLQPIFAALAALQVETLPVLYSDDAVEATRDQLLQLDGVLVWVDPIAFGENRSRLDELLREVDGKGVWASAHPDVILKMGTKEVLFLTRDLGWGTSTDLYRTADEFERRFPRCLATFGPRVLKQHRGNGGQGVWKVELLTGVSSHNREEAGRIPVEPGIVRVLEARRNSLEEDLPLTEFIARCAEYFAGAGCLVDQPFQARLPEGMIRCYLSQDAVIGFAHQLIRGLMPAPARSDASTLPQPGPRIMEPASTPRFQTLKRKMESEWVPAMCRTLGLDESHLPVLWDADFLIGAKNDLGEDTYVLCEINASCVTPFPEFAAGQIARTALAGTQAAQRRLSST